MAVVRQVRAMIHGQVPDDRAENDYDIFMHKLEALCSEHGLSLDEYHNCSND